MGIKDGIISSAIGAFYRAGGYGLTGPLCRLPGGDTILDSFQAYLLRACQNFSLSFFWCDKTVCENHGSDCDYTYKSVGWPVSKWLSDEENCVAELFPRVLALSTAAIYEEYGYSVEHKGEMGYYWWESDWADVVNNELIKNFCSDYFTAFSYGYLPDSVASIMSHYLIALYRCDKGFTTFSHYDCYTTAETLLELIIPYRGYRYCVMYYDVATYLSWDETGVLSRFYIKPPYSDPSCGGGPGCSYIKSSRFPKGLNLLFIPLLVILFALMLKIKMKGR